MQPTPTEHSTEVVGEGPEKQAVYAAELRSLLEADVPFLVGGGYALFNYLGRSRTTKDMDIFLTREAVEPALAALASAGFEVELTDASWLAKAWHDGALIDIIFCSYNGLLPVDETWMENGRPAEVLGLPALVVGPEEMIVSKCFVAARDRFDGGDVSSLLRVLAPRLDWARVETLMREHWLVLFWQLVHFIYVFPSEKEQIPGQVMQRLLDRFMRELEEPALPRFICRGPMLDPKRYRTASAEAARSAGEDAFVTPSLPTSTE